MLTVGKFGQVSLKYEKWELGMRGNENLASPPQTAGVLGRQGGLLRAPQPHPCSVAIPTRRALNADLVRCPHTAALSGCAGDGAEGLGGSWQNISLPGRSYFATESARHWVLELLGDPVEGQVVESS